MKIDDLFKENLHNSEMPVDNTLWERLNTKINNSNINTNNSTNNTNKTNTNNIKIKTNNTQIITNLKSLTTLTKTIISVVSSAVIITGGVLLYNNSIENTNNINTTKSQSVTNSNNNSISNKSSTDSTTQLIDNNLHTVTNTPQIDIIPKTEFIIEDYAIDQPSPNKDIYNFEDFSTKIDDSIMNNSYQMPIVDTQIYNRDDKRMNNKYQIKIKIPNVITPNGDGINDCFIINGIENYLDNKLIVFTRNGKVVYQKDNYNNEFCGQNLSQGVYFYRLRVRNSGYQKDFTGMLEIIK